MSYDEFMALSEDERRILFDALIQIYEIQLKRLSMIAADLLKKLKE